jgi:hypothetical protein
VSVGSARAGLLLPGRGGDERWQATGGTVAIVRRHWWSNDLHGTLHVAFARMRREAPTDTVTVDGTFTTR